MTAPSQSQAGRLKRRSPPRLADELRCSRGISEQSRLLPLALAPLACGKLRLREERSLMFHAPTDVPPGNRMLRATRAPIAPAQNRLGCQRVVLAHAAFLATH